MTRTVKASRKQQRTIQPEPPRMFLDSVQPLTENQRKAFESWKDNDHLFLHGIAGTGKTFLALFFALKTLATEIKYKKIYIVRSVVPSRDMGFLPGTPKEKAAVYEAPYFDICAKLYGNKNAYEMLKAQGLIEFVSTSFLRGTTFDNCIVIVDEIQNLNDQESHTVMTRVGENCRIIFCGDIKQDDLTSERRKEFSAIRKFIKIIRNMIDFSFVEFEVDDIVRSRIVKSYIIERDKLEMV